MHRFGFTKGLQDLGNNTYAYLQPDGSWGFSNAGLVIDSDEALLVDTLFDLALTREMLDAYSSVAGSCDYRYLVLTHGNGDHTFGNQLVPGAEIVASKNCREEMEQSPPRMMADLLAAADDLGDTGKYFAESFGAFDFKGIDLVFPTRFPDKELDLVVGRKAVRLVEAGPAHTSSDLIVYVPHAGVVFAGDMLFVGGMPIMWTGPFENWVSALDLILDMDAEIIVPGHGPVTDKAGVRQCRDILEEIYAGTENRFREGKTAFETSAELAGVVFPHLIDAERVVIMVNGLYKAFDARHQVPDVWTLFSQMAQLKEGKKS